MVNAESKASGLVESLRGHVLTPLTDARLVTGCESDEVEAERDAFRLFRERMAGIDTVPPPTTGPKRRIVTRATGSRPGARARRAYRETVMDVSHYDEVYDETLEANFVAELSLEPPAGRERGGTAFTDHYKSRLSTAVSQTVAQRETFGDTLDSELASLTRARDTLVTLLDQLDGPRIPGWYSEEFETCISDLVETRQDTLRTRDGLQYIDGHDLCTYLYQGQEWTYPILTAAARLRRSVDCRP